MKAIKYSASKYEITSRKIGAAAISAVLAWSYADSAAEMPDMTFTAIALIIVFGLSFSGFVLGGIGLFKEGISGLRSFFGILLNMCPVVFLGLIGFF